jgi:hypothetical protein
MRCEPYPLEKKEVACGKEEKQATSDQKTLIRISRGG